MLTVQVTLTEKEEAVLRMIAQGMVNKEIAAKLRTTVRMVKYYTAHLHAKLGTDHLRGSLIIFAYENGVVKPKGII